MMNKVVMVRTLADYQILAHTTSKNTDIKGEKVLYAVLGLGDEAGEVLGKFKKLYRDYDGVYDDKFKETIIKELGDVLWYIAEIATQLDICLEDIANQNIIKLYDRMDRNVICGSGDNR